MHTYKTTVLFNFSFCRSLPYFSPPPPPFRGVSPLLFMCH